MNWNSLIAEILSTGLTQKQIAEEVGCTQGAISDIYTGVTKHPRYVIAAPLIELHRRAVKKIRRKAVV